MSDIRDLLKYYSLDSVPEDDSKLEHAFHLDDLLGQFHETENPVYAIEAFIYADANGTPTCLYFRSTKPRQPAASPFITGVAGNYYLVATSLAAASADGGARDTSAAPCVSWSATYYRRVAGCVNSLAINRF